MSDPAHTLLIVKFDEEHPAVEALRNDIESFKAAYDQLADELNEAEEQRSNAASALDQALDSVQSIRDALAHNHQQQAALKDAIEFLTGKRP